MEEKRNGFLNRVKKYISIQDIKRTYSLLLPYIFQYKMVYLGLLLLLVVDICLTLTFAWFFGRITDAAVQGDFHRLNWLVLIGATLITISIISIFLNTYLEAISTNAIKRDIKSQLYKHVCLLPAGKVANLHSGELVSHFTNDVNSIDGAIGRSLINLIKFPFIYLAIFIYLVHIHWKLALLSLCIVPIAMITSVSMGMLLRRNTRLIHQLIGKINSLLNETFLGFVVIRAYTMEQRMFKNFSKQNQELYSLEVRNAKLRGWFHAGSQAVSLLTFLGSLCLGAYFVSNKVISVGSLLTFVSLVNYLIYPLTGLAGQWGGFQRSVSAVERIVEVLNQSVDSRDLPVYCLSAPISKSIQFQNVTFSYDNSINIFNDLDLYIPAGKMVAIVGSSGAGKTTLFNLLQGFYKPQSGTIRIDDRSTEAFTLSELRSCIAYVSQETYLFGGTIRENLVLARPNITEAEMIQSAKHANIHDFILTLPNGYDTEIGERGIKLSGGQKQRIAIARAILKDAPILLLDEATSALDSETEYQVQEALEHVMENRTTLVIAHRLSTIQNADVIVVMDEGKIVQIGNHEDLIKRNGLYRDLNRIHVS